MALGAHPVPVLATAGPVQFILGRDALVGIKVKPASAACFPGTRVPGDGQGLHPPIGESDQVLLQGGDAEGVADLVILKFAVRPLGRDEKAALAAEEAAGDTEMGEAGVIEIA